HCAHCARPRYRASKPPGSRRLHDSGPPSMTVAQRPVGSTAALDAALGRSDEIADATFPGWNVPGLIYGIVRDGSLVHSRGLGTLRVGADATPTTSSIFRIASMTKSFTAATVLLLRDAGTLPLHDEKRAVRP